MGSIRLIVVFTLLVGALQLARARPASPAGLDQGPAAAFGSRGAVVLALSAASAWREKSPSFGYQGVSGRLAAQVFVAPRLSVGITGGAQWYQVASAGSSYLAKEYEVGARVGGLLSIGSWASFWPQLGVGFIRTPGVVTLWQPAGGTAEPQEPGTTALELTLDLPVLLHPLPWFFVGFGPTLDATVASDRQSGELGGRFTFGGEFNASGG